MRFIGIDYGDSATGIAISDEEGAFAFPKTVVRGPWLKTKRELEKIISLEFQDSIEAFIVGLPQNFKGTDTQQTKKARDFGEKLKKEFGIKVIFQNELLTTKEVQKNIAAPKHKTDASSAALILQSFLDYRR